MARELKIDKEHHLHDLTSVSEVTLPIAKQILGPRGFMHMDLLTSWSNIVGENMARYSLPQKIVFPKDLHSDGCLTIMVPAGAFAMEITQNEPQIIDKVNTYFGYPAIKKIKILQNGAPQDFLLGKKPINKIKKSVVTDKEESYITEITKDIKQLELRKIIADLGRAVFMQHKEEE